MQVTEKPVLVSPARAADMLDCGLTTIYDAMKKGKLRWVAFLDGRRIPFSEIERVKREGLR